MTHIDQLDDPWGFDNPTPQQQLADENLRAQEHLWAALAQARKDSGRSLENVASRLGIPVDLLEAIEGGRVNISMSDLRELAYAVDALVTYKVTPNYPDRAESHRRAVHELTGRVGSWKNLAASDDWHRAGSLRGER